MNVIYDRPEAALLPSRRRFALTRLIAFVRLSFTRIGVRHERVALAVDRDQNAVETYAVGAWFTITTAVYIAAFLPLRTPYAIAIAIACTPMAIQIPFYISGGLLDVMRNRDNRTFNAVTEMTLLTIASSFVAVMPSPARFVAWFFFGVLALNSIAFVVLWLLRAKVRALETRCGA